MWTDPQPVQKRGSRAAAAGSTQAPKNTNAPDRLLPVLFIIENHIVGVVLLVPPAGAESLGAKTAGARGTNARRQSGSIELVGCRACTAAQQPASGVA